MGMNLPSKKGGSVSEINVTPLIDIMLVMLIIFMVITPPTVTQMAANLPEKSEEVPEDQVPEDQLVAAACKDGTFALNRSVMTIEELAEQVEKRLKAKAKKVVFVDAHPDASYEHVVTLMDTVRDAGSERVGIASLKEDADFTACTPAPAAPVDPAAPAPAGG